MKIVSKQSYLTTFPVSMSISQFPVRDHFRSTSTKTCDTLTLRTGTNIDYDL